MKKQLVFIFALLSCAVSGQDLYSKVESRLIDGDYSGALQLIDRDSHRSDVRIRNAKAQALIHSNKFGEAEKEITEALSGASSSIEQAALKATLGLLYMTQGRNDLALEELQSAVQQFETIGAIKSIEGARALSLLGLAYKYNGKHNQAQDHLRMALEYRLQLLDAKHEWIAASYNDLGLAFAGMNNDKALEFYEKALEIYISLHGNEHPKIAIAKINIGYIYSNLELYGDATNNFESALKIWEKIYTGAHPAKAFALLNLGDTYARIGNLEAAEGYLTKSLDMYRLSYGDKHPEIAGVLNKLANIKVGQNKYDEGLALLQQALLSNSERFKPQSVTDNPDIDDYYNGNVLLYTMLFKARALEKQYFGKTLRFKDLEIALITLERCDKLIDQLRQSTSAESDKISLGILANELYADGVRIAHEASVNAWSKKQYQEKAFYFAERSKSAVLLEAISDAEAKSFAGIPSSLMEQEKQMKASIALTTQLLSQKPTLDEEKALRQQLFVLNRKFETFTKTLEAQYPDYYNLKYDTRTPLIADVQNAINDRTAVLSYFIDDSQKRLYTFLITKRKLKITDRSIPADFDKQITGLRNSLFFSEMKVVKTTARNLGSMLLPSIPSSIKHLVILPIGRLSIIPFETLLLQDADNEDAKTLPYLIKKYAVQYEFSAGLLLQKSKSQTTQAAPSILLCAPVKFAEDERLSELPASESEVKAISELFSNKRLTSTSNLYASASETLIKDPAVNQYTYLHLATHGVVDEKNPELSRIFLQRGQPSDDGRLYAGEIYSLKLNANLVTLSACQTGLGKISKGEGVIGLSRALVYAGAKNVIVSFWSVADASTAELMKEFYRNLLDNSESAFSESLRASKLKLINSNEYNSPYYWAPFILIGY